MLQPWCSLVNTSPCHGEDRRFKSGRLRKRKQNYPEVGSSVSVPCRPDLNEGWVGGEATASPPCRNERSGFKTEGFENGTSEANE